MERPKRSKRHRAPNTALIELRINEGLTPADLAYRCGTSAKTIRLAEAGFTPGPRIQFEIAKVFGVRPLEIWPLERQKVAALR
jgi:lambda repressor-like predicted transcriptional regulator